MTGRVQITFRRILPSDAVREVVLQKFEKLCSRLPTGARCHVVIDRAGGAMSARLEITSGRLRICSEGRSGDTCQAVRESFDRANAQSERRQAGRADTRSSAALSLMH